MTLNARIAEHDTFVGRWYDNPSSPPYAFLVELGAIMCSAFVM